MKSIVKCFAIIFTAKIFLLPTIIHIEPTFKVFLPNLAIFNFFKSNCENYKSRFLNIFFVD